MCRKVVRALCALLLGGTSPPYRTSENRSTSNSMHAGIGEDTVSNPMPEVKVLIDNVHEFCNSDKPDAELIFFHDFQFGDENVRQSHLRTWTKKNSPHEYWPQTLFKEDGLQVRALTVSYDAYKEQTATTGRVDLFLIAETLVRSIIDIDRINVGQTDGVPVILVGHCFGGLVIKEFIKQACQNLRRADGRTKERCQKFLDNLGGVFYYSTPHVALKGEVVEKLFPKKGHTYSPLVRNFEELNKHVARLEKEMGDCDKLLGGSFNGVRKMDLFETNETNLGFWKGILIEEASARSSSSSSSSFIAEDHFDICRPDSTSSINFQMLANLIRDVRGSYKPEGARVRMSS